MSEQEKPQPIQEEIDQAAAEKLAKQEAKKAAAKAEKEAKEAKKAERLAARQAAAAKTDTADKDPNDPAAAFFGDMPIIRSQIDPEERFKIKYHKVEQVTEELVGQEVRILARISNSRAQAKSCFVVLREGWASFEGVLFGT